MYVLMLKKKAQLSSFKLARKKLLLQDTLKLRLKQRQVVVFYDNPFKIGFSHKFDCMSHVILFYLVYRGWRDYLV